jgi:predicted negative regulator of RcsB-dependent stress response
VNKTEEPSAEVLEHYGDILFLDGQTDKAVEQWQKALELDGENELLMRKFNDQTYYEK